MKEEERFDKENDYPEKKKGKLIERIIEIFITICIAIIIIMILFICFVMPDTTATLKKPVIYLYPEEEMEVEVKVGFNEDILTTTYPKYENGWKITAKPDGTLYDKSGEEYRYLFWEAIEDVSGYDLTKGVVVTPDNAAEVLRKILGNIGLNSMEYNEFIAFWLPAIEENEYTLLHFETEQYNKDMPLVIHPEPDTLIRVFMVMKEVDKSYKVKEQGFTNTERVGFTVVEWGGTVID